MVLITTILSVSDNSGGLLVKCLKILNNKSIGRIGNLLLVSLSKVNPKKKLLSGQLYKCVLVRMRKKILRNGGYIFANENAVVLLNNNLMPFATRIFGPILREIRYNKKFSKIIALAKFIV